MEVKFVADHCSYSNHFKELVNLVLVFKNGTDLLMYCKTNLIIAAYPLC